MSILDINGVDQNSVMFHDPTGKINGTPGAVVDSGQPVTMFTGSSTGGTPDAYVYRDGYLAFNAYDQATAVSDAAAHAVYYQVDVGETVTRIKANTLWPAASTGASQIAIVVPSSPWGLPAPPGPGLPDAGIHFVMSGNGQWHVGDWTNPVENTYGSDTIYGRCAPQDTGVEGTIELFINHAASSLTVIFQDGKIVTMSDPQIATATADLVIFESFVSAGISDIPPVFGKFVADSQQVGFTSRTPSKLEVAKLIDEATRTNWDKAATALSGGSTSLTANSAMLQQFSGTTGTVVLPSTDVPVGLPFYLVNSMSGALTVNASGGGFLAALSAGTTALVISMAASPTVPGSWVALPFVIATSLSQTLDGKTYINGKWTQPINAQTGTTYTLVVGDSDKLVTLDNAAAITLTVPLNTSAAIPVGRSIDLAQLGVGQVTVVPAGGVTVNGTPGLKIAAQYGKARLTKLATDIWLIAGDLAA